MGRAYSPGTRHSRCGGPGWLQWRMTKQGARSLFGHARLLLLLELSACLCTGVWGFEVFSEQQIVKLNDPTVPVYFNNTEVGSTYVEDYWAKLDINFSPLEGWSLFKHVRLGCFNVDFHLATEGVSYLVKPEDIEETDISCVSYCNRTQTYFKYPTCHCGIVEADLTMEEVDPRPTCTEESWEVFREYDYRSSMSPATYDVARRLLYQIISVRVANGEENNLPKSELRTYIHAVNAMEAKPKFEYDTLLDRMVFNAVWDFGKSRMVALSIPEWDDGWQLDFTIVTFNSSTGVLKTDQAHFPISNQLGRDTLVTARNLASVDGLSTLDILYGTYYTVVPADYTYGDDNVTVHAIIAIDIEKKMVLFNKILPLSLMNMQMNALKHILYGAASYVTGKYAYYELCSAENVTETVGDLTQNIVRVSCTDKEIGSLPEEAEQMYIQSAAIDHQYNYAWFTYKKAASAQPLMLEYHHDELDYTLWKEDTFGLDVAYPSLIQTAPRIIFALYPPTLKYAKFNSAGTKIFLRFDAATLQGAVPIDSDGDEIPDYYNKGDTVTRAKCEDFLDDFTMKLIEDSMCQWTSETDIFIEITLDAKIVPGDLVRIRANTVFAGKKSSSGVYQFSQPSTDFAVVEVPDEILIPVVAISAYEYIDTCTELLLDGSPSYGHGYRGTFTWSLNRTEPFSSEPHERQIQKIMLDKQPAGQSQQWVRIPPKEMMGDTTYFFDLTVTSFFAEYVDEAARADLSTTYQRRIRISALPVPALLIYGADRRAVQGYLSQAFTSYLTSEGECLPDGKATMMFAWHGCLESEVVESDLGLMGCPANPRWTSGPFDYRPEDNGPLGFSGVSSRSLLIEANTLQLFQSYTFTLFVNVSYSGETLPMRNQASVTARVILSGVEVRNRGGNGFSMPRQNPVVIDVIPSEDPADPNNSLGFRFFNYSCEMGAERSACPIYSSGRRLEGENSEPVYYEPTILPYIPCIDILDEFGEPLWFIARGTYYKEAEGITNLDAAARGDDMYCMSEPTGILIVARMAFPVGYYTFNVNMTKELDGTARDGTSQVNVDATEETPTAGTDLPILNVTLNGSLPVNKMNVIRMQGIVSNARNDTSYTYRWSAFKWSANPQYDIDTATTSVPGTYKVPKELYVPVTSEELDFANWKDVRTPMGSRFVVTVPNVLSPNVQYKFRLTASDSVLEARGLDATTGFAELAFTTTGLPPSGGRLESSNLTGVSFESVFVLEMLGWGTEDLPIKYYFAYKQDSDDALCPITYLSAVYSDEWKYITPLPPGLAMPNNRLTSIGYARSSIGATAQTELEISVEPVPVDVNMPEMLMGKVTGLPPETGLLMGIMAAQTIDVGEREALTDFLYIVENETDMRAFLEMNESDFEVRGQPVPLSEQVITQQALFLTILSDKGLKTDRCIEDLESITIAGDGLAFLNAEDTFSPQGINVALSLLTTVDSYFPAPVDSLANESQARRLEDIEPGQGIYYSRALQSALSDNRTDEEKYSQYNWVRGIERGIGNDLVNQLVPGEVPANFYMQGHDFYVGQAMTKVDDAAKGHSYITESFDVPMTSQTAFQEMMEAYQFQYIQYKKFAFTFIPLPAGKTIAPPIATSGATESKVPDQGYSPDVRLWHAMSLELSDTNGGRLDGLINTALEEASYSMLPKLDAHYVDNWGPANFAATCYRLVEGANVTDGDTYYDAKGITFSEQSCVTNHLSTFIVVLDDLMLDLSLVEEIPNFPKCLFDAFTDCSLDQLTPIQELRSTASASSLVLTTLMLFGAMAVGWYLDEGCRDKYKKDPRNKAVQPIDGNRKIFEQPWFHMEEPTEKFFAAFAYFCRRNHLIVGFGTWHRRLSREKRVVVWYLAFAATEALLTVMHSKMNFRAKDVFVATGIMAGILVFPIIQGAMFLFEWRPDTLVKAPPPTSNPPKPIPLKQAAERVDKLHAPKAPLAPTLIRPPDFRNITRIALPAHLTLPVVKPGPPPVPGKQSRFPPPKRQMLTAKPPPGPPPANHLTASRVLGAIGDVPGRPMSPGAKGAKGATPKMKALPATSKMLPLPGIPVGPDGQMILAVPELPKLSTTSASAAFGKAPAPPPKPPSAGPRPPQKPPPLTKMYFTVPKNQMKVPQVPALRGGGTFPKGPGLPALPNLPQLMRPPTLSLVKQSGDAGIAPGPPPPPPPPKAAAHAHHAPDEPIAPKTPGRDDDGPELPGGVIAPEDTPRPPSRGPATDRGEGLVTTLHAPPVRSFDNEARHGAPPPEDVDADPVTRLQSAPPHRHFDNEARHGMQPYAPEDVEADAALAPVLREDPEHAAPPPPPKAPAGAGPVFSANRFPEPPPTAGPPRGGAPVFQVTGPAAAPELPSLPDTGPKRMGAGGMLPPPPIRQQAGGADATMLPGQMQFQPPPVAPPPGITGQSEFRSALGPLALGIGGAPPKRGPALPQLPTPQSMLLRVPSIKQHAPGLVPPPPPPKQQLKEAIVAKPQAPHPKIEAPPKNARTLQSFQGAGPLVRVQPKPPPKRPQAVMLPTPPSGPPPAHAIVINGKPPKKEGPAPNAKTAPKFIGTGKEMKGDIDLDAVRKRMTGPPPVPKPPPTASLPVFTHKGTPKVSAGPPSIAQVEAQKMLEIQNWQPENKPIKDWVLKTTHYAAWIVVGTLIGNSMFFSLFYGSYLDDISVWATHAATVIGLLVNCGLFETLKCVVLASLALVKDETEKRSYEVDVRRQRMRLKAQRLQSEGRWAPK